MKKTILATAIALASASAFAGGNSLDAAGAIAGTAASGSAATSVGSNGGFSYMSTGSKATNETWAGAHNGSTVAGSEGYAGSETIGITAGQASGEAGSMALQGGVAGGVSTVRDVDAAYNRRTGDFTYGGASGVAGSVAGQATGAATGVEDNGYAQGWAAAGAENKSNVDVDVDSSACRTCTGTEISLEGSTEGYSYVVGGNEAYGNAIGMSGGIAGQAGGFQAEGSAKVKDRGDVYMRSNSDIEGYTAGYSAGGGVSAFFGKTGFYNENGGSADAGAYTEIRHCEYCGSDKMIEESNGYAVASNNAFKGYDYDFGFAAAGATGGAASGADYNADTFGIMVDLPTISGPQPVQTSGANNGWGNGDQDAPGNSGDHNQAENSDNDDPRRGGRRDR